MIGLLNVGSLMLGLIAWILPVISLVSYEKHKLKNGITFSMISISACAISLCFQIIYNYHLVKIKDWNALMDTTGAVVYASLVLLIVTIILNAVTLFVIRHQSVKQE